MNVATLLFAAALFHVDLPEPQRVERLRLYFDPAVGSEIRLSADELRDYAGKRPSTALRGFIRVKPPRGQCFTVQRADEIPDEIVCKEQNLTFQLSDLQHDGSLKWLVKTGDGDFGTMLKWQSRYRLVLSVPQGKESDAPERRFLHGCEAQRLADGERRVILRFVSGGSWVLKFPPRDTLVANQPMPINNLGLVDPPPASWAIPPPSPEKKGSTPEPSASPSADGAKTPESPSASDTEVSASQPVMRTDEDEAAEEEKWHIPKRGSFSMSAENFIPFGAVSPGIKGLCRYRYRGDDVDPKTPMVECRDADGFEQVIIPVVCLAKPHD